MKTLYSYIGSGFDVGRCRSLNATGYVVRRTMTVAIPVMPVNTGYPKKEDRT